MRTPEEIAKEYTSKYEDDLANDIRQYGLDLMAKHGLKGGKGGDHQIRIGVGGKPNGENGRLSVLMSDGSHLPRFCNDDDAGEAGLIKGDIYLSWIIHQGDVLAVKR